MTKYCLLFVFFLTTSTSALKIHLITYSNGVGLSRDIDLLINELTKLRHDVRYIHFLDFEAKPKADINIFIEHISEFFISLAEKNYFIPNPEWYLSDIALIKKMDLILCKTKEALKIFKNLNPNSTFTSFTCQDRHDSSIQKNYKLPLHLVGKSSQKGTTRVINVWKNHPLLPQLLLLKNFSNPIENLPNLKVIEAYLSDQDIQILQNHCGIHICTSETEGFGHYIFEALSCQAVVITTNGPPMNEFIKDSRCLVPFNLTSEAKLATNYYIDENELAKTMKNLLQLSEKELGEIGKKNREYYLENDKFFKKRLKEIFGTYIP